MTLAPAIPSQKPYGGTITLSYIIKNIHYQSLRCLRHNKTVKLTSTVTPTSLFWILRWIKPALNLTTHYQTSSRWVRVKVDRSSA